MGQQQLLLIVLGVIIVGIAIILGIVLFQQMPLIRKEICSLMKDYSS
jgi:hypothetical protein